LMVEIRLPLEVEIQSEVTPAPEGTPVRTV